MPFKRILIEDEADRYGFGPKILSRLKGLPVEKGGAFERTRDLEDMDKETLRLVCFKGQFMKPCPGTKEYICCGYQILQVGTNCPMDCSYCILQAYFNQPSVRVFVNLEENLDLIDHVIDGQSERIFRIGTGEFTDSLAVDPIVHWSKMLVPRFSKKKNTVLELKTKSDLIEGLLAMPERDRIVVSWSLNSPDMITKEEKGTAGLKKRLAAAKRCQAEGFILGFHFDPLVFYPGWEEGYSKTLELLDKYVDPRRVIWVSLGCLRYMPSLKPIIRKRHPSTHILDGEFIPGLDGKMRYFKPIRIEMYAFMSGALNDWHHDLGVYLCMESHEVWEKGIGWSPVHSDGLSSYLDNRVLKVIT